jgi:dihydropteroate synthase
MYTLNCKGKLLEIDQPLIMGIINATPDSFFEGHLSNGTETIANLAAKMLEEGAGIIDVGGQSTRPRSKRISADEELQRVVPVIEAIKKTHPDSVISIDTYHAKVALAAVQAGASMVNDISAGNMDEAMLSTVASLNVPFIAMHMQGRPETMQQSPQYENVVTEVLDFFIKKVNDCHKAGIKDVIIDPGFGFGKTTAHNFQLLKQLNIFKMTGKPILAGLSRKGSIYKTLNITAAEALNGTTCVNTIALLNGADILRVHDVKEAMQVIKLLQVYQHAW